MEKCIIPLHRLLPRVRVRETSASIACRTSNRIDVAPSAPTIGAVVMGGAKNCICTDRFDVTGRSRAATRERRARAMRPTRDARGRAIGIVCACVLLASVATAQRWVRETRRCARARAPMRRKRARRTRRRATIVERASERARDRSNEGWTDRLTRRRYCCVIVPSP